MQIPLATVSDALPYLPPAPTVFLTPTTLEVDDTRARATWPRERAPAEGRITRRSVALGDPWSIERPLSDLLRDAVEPEGTTERAVLVVPTPDVPFGTLASVLATAAQTEYDGIYVAVATPRGSGVLRLAIPKACGDVERPRSRLLEAIQADWCTPLAVEVGTDTVAVRTAAKARRGCGTAAWLMIDPVVVDPRGMTAVDPASEGIREQTCAVAPRSGGLAALAPLLPGVPPTYDFLPAEGIVCFDPALAAGADVPWGELAPIWAALDAIGGGGGVTLVRRDTEGGRCE